MAMTVLLRCRPSGWTRPLPLRRHVGAEEQPGLPVGEAQHDPGFVKAAAGDSTPPALRASVLARTSCVARRGSRTAFVLARVWERETASTARRNRPAYPQPTCQWTTEPDGLLWAEHDCAACAAVCDQREGVRCLYERVGGVDRDFELASSKQVPRAPAAARRRHARRRRRSTRPAPAWAGLRRRRREETRPVGYAPRSRRIPPTLPPPTSAGGVHVVLTGSDKLVAYPRPNGGLQVGGRTLLT
jgi:hypothetical protein